MKEKHFRLRWGLIVSLALLLLLSATLMTGRGYAKYRTQAVINDTLHYSVPSVSLAKSVTVSDGGESQNAYDLIPGTTVNPSAEVNVTDRTETPAYLYIEVVGDFVPVDGTCWKKLDGVTGANGGDVYVYTGNDMTNVPVFGTVTLGEELETDEVTVKVYAYLIEQQDEKSPEDTINNSDAARMVAGPLTEVFVPAVVSSTANEDYTVKNTGSIPAYIRAVVVTNWVDENGDVAFGEVPAVTYGTDWEEIDGYVYYNKGVLAKSASTAPVIQAVSEMPAPEGCTLQITVLTEAIQAEPAGAVQNAWHMTYQDGVWTAVTNP